MPTTGGPEPYLYAGNGIEFAQSSQQGSIDNLLVTDVFDSCLTAQTFSNQQSAAGFSFSNSKLERCGFAGVEISVLSNGGSSGSMLQQVSMNGLDIREAGKGWSGQRYGTEGHGIRIKADAGAGKLDGISIDNSLISTAAGNGIDLSGDSGLINLSRLAIFNNDGNGIRLADAGSSSLQLKMITSIIYRNGDYGIYYNAPVGAGLQLYHNSLADNTGINLAILAVAGSTDVRNNLFYNSSAMTHFFINNSPGNIRLNHNCYRETVNMFGYNGTAYSSVTAFQATGLETQGKGATDIALSSPTTDDFHLTTGSICIAAGASGLEVNRDFAGNEFSTPPDIGAFAYAPPGNL